LRNYLFIHIVVIPVAFRTLTKMHQSRKLGFSARL
jgi:hypothetical protein